MEVATRGLLHHGIKELFNSSSKLEHYMDVDLKTFARRFGIGTILYIAGSLIPAMIILILSDHIHLHVTGAKTMFVLTVVASFICGFGWQLLYLNKCANAGELTLKEIIIRSFAGFRTNWKKPLVYACIGILISSLLDVAITQLLGLKSNQVAARLAAHLQGLDLIMFAVLAAVIAPLVEETLFRGYVFNALRSAFRRTKFAGGKKADPSATLLSAALFAGMHMEPSAFIQLFVFGILLAEVYRRSGTIASPMLMHAINNSVAVSMLLLQ
jgi:membrane protease YdiL (CAAX protease family)